MEIKPNYKPVQNREVERIILGDLADVHEHTPGLLGRLKAALIQEARERERGNALAARLDATTRAQEAAAANHTRELQVRDAEHTAGLQEAQALVDAATRECAEASAAAARMRGSADAVVAATTQALAHVKEQHEGAERALAAMSSTLVAQARWANVTGHHASIPGMPVSVADATAPHSQAAERLAAATDQTAVRSIARAESSRTEEDTVSRMLVEEDPMLDDLEDTLACAERAWAACLEHSGRRPH